MFAEETPPKGMRFAGSDSRAQVMEPEHMAPAAGVPPSCRASADGDGTPTNPDTTGALRPSAAARRSRSRRPTCPRRTPFSNAISSSRWIIVFPPAMGGCEDHAPVEDPQAHVPHIVLGGHHGTRCLRCKVRLISTGFR